MSTPDPMNPMNMATMGALGIDPATYAKVMRQMQLSQIGTEMALTPAQVQQPQGSNRGFYQAARVNPLSGLVKLAEAYMARKGLDTAATNMGQMYGGALDRFQPGGQPQAPEPTGPGAGIISPEEPPSAQNAAQGVTYGPAPQPTTGGINPLNPVGLPAELAMRLYVSKPEVYAQQLMGTPEWQTALRAYGSPQLAMAALQAKYAKEGTIERRPGMEADVPVPGQPGIYHTIRTPNLPPGYDYMRDEQGNIASVQPIPGYFGASTQQEALKTAAEQQNTPRMIPQGGGSEALGYPPSPPAFRGMPGAPGPGTPPTGAAPGGNPMGVPGSAPGGSPGLPTPAPKSYFGPPPAPAPAGATVPQGPAPLPQKDQNGIFSNNLWQGIPKVVIPSTPGRSSDAYTMGTINAQVAKNTELNTKYGEQAALGNQSLAYYQEALKNLPAAEVGPMSEWLTENRSRLIQMAPGLAGILGNSASVTPTLELNKELKNAALQGAKATYGRLTQMEVKLQTDEMSPSVSMTRDAIAALVRQNMMRASYQIQQAKDYGEYAGQHGDPQQFEAQYNVRRPITRFAAQYDTPPAALDRLKANPAILPDFNKRYGWNPTQ